MTTKAKKITHSKGDTNDVYGATAGPATAAEQYLRDAQSNLIRALSNVNDSLENLDECVDKYTAELTLDAFVLLKRYVEQMPKPPKEEAKAA